MAAPYTHMSKVGKLIFEVSSFKNEKSRHLKVVNEHYLNYGVGLVLPGCRRVPDFVTSHLCTEKAYLIQQLPISSLIDKQFVEAFVKKGDVYMMSHGTRIDTEDCAALLPTGLLVLNLTKDTYETLGLEGKPSVNGGKKPGKFIVNIDLNPSYFTPGKKNYDRVKWCLEQNFPVNLNFLMTWVSNEEKICASSIAMYFEKKGYQVLRLNMKQSSKIYRDTDVPEINSRILEPADQSCGYTEVYEWLGAISCNCNIAGGPDEYLSALSCPSPTCNSRLQSCTCYRIEGMFTTSTLQCLLQDLRTHVAKGDYPWVALTVHGFTDSPVSWQNREHGFHKSGENLYTYMVFPNEDYWLFMATDANDVCP